MPDLPNQPNVPNMPKHTQSAIEGKQSLPKHGTQHTIRNTDHATRNTHHASRVTHTCTARKTRGLRQECRRHATRHTSPVTRKLCVFADASVHPQATGLGAVIKDERGQLIAWRSRTIDAMTSNEAEYHALIFALEQVQSFSPRELEVFSDSKLVVEQMRGLYRVHSDLLRNLHRRATALAEEFDKVTFTHISRERNQLADTIADDAARRMKDER